MAPRSSSRSATCCRTPTAASILEGAGVLSGVAMHMPAEWVARAQAGCRRLRGNGRGRRRTLPAGGRSRTDGHGTGTDAQPAHRRALVRAPVERRGRASRPAGRARSARGGVRVQQRHASSSRSAATTEARAMANPFTPHAARRAHRRARRPQPRVLPAAREHPGAAHVRAVAAGCPTKRRRASSSAKPNRRWTFEHALTSSSPTCPKARSPTTSWPRRRGAAEQALPRPPVGRGLRRQVPQRQEPVPVRAMGLSHARGLHALGQRHGQEGVRAGGELLERYRLTRGRFDVGQYSQLKTDRVGRIKADQS
jgi:hypothetical protein